MTVLLNKKYLRQETLQDVPSIAFSGLCKDVICLCFQGQNPFLGCTWIKTDCTWLWWLETWRYNTMFHSNLQAMSTNRQVFMFMIYALNSVFHDPYEQEKKSHIEFRGGSVTWLPVSFTSKHMLCVLCTYTATPSFTWIEFLLIFDWFIDPSSKSCWLPLCLFLFEVTPARECIHWVLFLWKGVNSATVPSSVDVYLFLLFTDLNSFSLSQWLTF